MPVWLPVVLHLIVQMQDTPYVPAGNSLAGTDCSGLASFVSNIATGRDPFSGRFWTGIEEAALRERGFVDGDEPGHLVIGWNSYHTAVTLPDGTNVSSGEHGGVHIGGGGAHQAGFTRHMWLPEPEPAPEDTPLEPAAPDDAPPPAEQPGEVT
jgi:hypothetical protein